MIHKNCVLIYCPFLLPLFIVTAINGNAIEKYLSQLSYFLETLLLMHLYWNETRVFFQFIFLQLKCLSYLA